MSGRRIYSDEQRRLRANLRARLYARANPDKIIKANKDWHARNPKKASKYAMAWAKRHPKKAKQILDNWKKRNPGRMNELSKAWAKNNPDKIRGYMLEKYQAKKDFLTALKQEIGCQGKKCKIREPIVLQWAHITRRGKSPSISAGMSWKLLGREIKKCILLCANCHLIFDYPWRQVMFDRLKNKKTNLLKMLGKNGLRTS